MEGCLWVLLTLIKDQRFVYLQLCIPVLFASLSRSLSFLTKNTFTGQQLEGNKQKKTKITKNGE